MIEWGSIPFRLETDVGTLYFNDTSGSGPLYGLIDNGCRATRTLRAPIDQIPQGDGEIFHKRFRNGTEIELHVALWESPQTPACDQQLREMYEELVAHLDSMVNGGGRLIWQPSGYSDERMLDAARYLTPITREDGGGAIVGVKFTLDSPFPYVIDKTQVDDPEGHTSPSGASSILVQAGVPKTITLPEFSAPFFPVMQVNGPLVGDFTIENESVTDEWGDPLVFVYDSTRAGAIGIIGGDYAEIDTFRETIYLNGNETNMKPGVDPEVTDFFYLKPGDNVITSDSVDVDFLVNYAWSVA